MARAPGPCARPATRARESCRRCRPCDRRQEMTLDAAITPLELSQSLATFPPPTLIDVRRQPAFDDDPHVIPGALRRLPEAVDDWAGALEPWRPVVVYCVRGHE